MKLYIVRHGQTDWNAKGVLQGNTDIPLNQMGKAQAERIRKELENISIDICISSPLKRAYETAEIIYGQGKPIITDSRLEERELGSLEGKDAILYDAKMYWNYSLNSSNEGVECIQDLFKRTTEFYNDLKDKYMNDTVLIVAHGAVVRALNYVITGYTKDTDFLSFDVPNCRVFSYEVTY